MKQLLSLALLLFAFTSCQLDSVEVQPPVDPTANNTMLEADKNQGAQSIADAINQGKVMIQNELDAGASIAFVDIEVWGCNSGSCSTSFTSSTHNESELSKVTPVTDDNMAAVVKKIHELSLSNDQIDLIFFSSQAKGKINWGLVITTLAGLVVVPF